MLKKISKINYILIAICILAGVGIALSVFYITSSRKQLADEVQDGLWEGYGRLRVLWCWAEFSVIMTTVQKHLDNNGQLSDVGKLFETGSELMVAYASHNSDLVEIIDKPHLIALPPPDCGFAYQYHIIPGYVCQFGGQRERTWNHKSTLTYVGVLTPGGASDFSLVYGVKGIDDPKSDQVAPSLVRCLDNIHGVDSIDWITDSIKESVILSPRGGEGAET